ncbi:hypothetical protein TorRG33x02_146560, partial [Trema orientale]
DSPYYSEFTTYIFLPKILTYQFGFFEMNRCPPIIPKTKPHPYPISTAFQPKPFSDSKSGGIGVPSVLCSSHIFGKGTPHKSKFPSKEDSPNVSNCVLCGIGPVSWFSERLRYWRKVRLASC